MKRFLSLLFSVLFLCSALNLNAFALFNEPDPDGYAGSFGYNRIASGKEAEIIGYYGLGGEETIPETAGGLPVTSVKLNGIYCPDDAQITVLHLPGTLKNFSAESLQNCVELAEVTIPEENEFFRMENGLLLTSDGTKVVLCPAATSMDIVIIPEGVTTIGVQAFADCAKIKRVVFPKTLTTIESGTGSGQLRGAFENCTGLEALRFPMGIRTIGNYAFFGCSSLREVTFLNEVEVSVGLDAFCGCPNLSSVLLPSGVSPIDAEAFGHLPGIEDPADTRKVENFTIYGINGSAAKTYATATINDFNFAKLDIITDVMSGAQITGSIPNISGFSGTQLAGGAEAYRAYFNAEDPMELVRCQVTAKKQTTITQPFVTKAHYCVPLPEGVSEESMYLFRITNGKPEYLASDCYPGTDWMGNPIDEMNIYFEADTTGDFVFVNGASNPGCVCGGEEFDLSDLTLLAKFVAGWQVFPKLLNSDVTGDGLIDMSDITLLAKSIAGWNVTLLNFGVGRGA